MAGREDIVAWHFNKNGFFSVRSAYHVQWTHKFGGNLVQEQAPGVGDVVVCKNSWNLEIPSKVKISVWRVL